MAVSFFKTETCKRHLDGLEQCGQTSPVLLCEKSNINHKANEQIRTTSDPREEADTRSTRSCVHLHGHTDRRSVTQLQTTDPTQNSSSGVSGHDGEELLLIYFTISVSVKLVDHAAQLLITDVLPKFSSYSPQVPQTDLS